MKPIALDKIIIFSLIFGIVLMPSLYMPMISDDYSYYLMGLSFSSHYAHYISWSGRLVSDIISPLLLTTMPRYAYEIINSVAFALLMLFIASVSTDSESKGKAKFILRSAFIFVLYWIANPNLGQTSFWIVGSANYLWTNMFIAAFFIYLLRAINYNKFNSVMMFLLAFLAGCSNENTAIVAVMITVFIVFFEKASTRIKVTSLSGIVLGAGLLILSPGNQARLNLFEVWNSLSFAQKLVSHFYFRFPQAVSEYWQVYIVLIAAMVISSFAGTLRKRTIIYMSVFFVASLLANAAMVGAPVVPPRSMNGGLCFLLIATSFALSDALRSAAKFEIGLLSACALFCAIYFIPSYYLFNIAMQSTYEQAKIRDNMIIKGKEAGIENVKIPEFYFPLLLKYYDRFELSNSKFMAKYYGVKSTETFRINFDYSRIYDSRNIKLNLPLYDDLKLKGMYFFSENLGFKHFAVLELSATTSKKMSAGDKIFIHIYKKGSGKFINADVDIAPLNIDGKYFIGREVKDAAYDKIQKIRIGIYNTKSNSMKFDTTIYMQ